MSKLETNTIDTISGTNTLQVGDGNVATINLGKSGDTVNIPSGATLNIAGTAGTGFPANTPAFEAYLGSDQTVTSGTTTKITMNTETFDSAGAYDNSSNYRFTPQTAGKYYVYATVRGSANTSALELQMAAIYKNGSTYIENQTDFRGGDGSLMGATVVAIVDMNGSSDYLECYGRCLGGTTIKASPTRSSIFGAYKIIV
jgi:hypothetical protein